MPNFLSAATSSATPLPCGFSRRFCSLFRLVRGRCRNSSDMMMPARDSSRSDAVRQTHEWAAATFPLQQDLLVTWKGSSLHDPRVAEFRRSLEPQQDAKGVLRGRHPADCPDR